jgi:hypothetical protein
LRAALVACNDSMRLFDPDIWTEVTGGSVA